MAGNTFNATISLSGGNQLINVVAEDELGGIGMASRLVSVDSEGPEIKVDAPRDRQSVYTGQPTIEISYDDFNGSARPMQRPDGF